ncbi:NACHT domain-containing protein [Nonomuraea sp. NPDC052116]|uniref:NACHT domain-containing protein n=1 Tax=Nonomuraea sp. NPDC052116 TaxID=3155665 RepID=UPI00342D44B5
MGSGGRGRWVVSPVALAVVPVGIGLVGNLATGTVEVKAWWWTPATWVLTGVLVVVATASQIVQSRAVPQSREAAMRSAAAGLRRMVREQWEHETVLRGVRQPVPLRVRWSSTDRQVAETRQVVLDEPETTWQDRPLEGDVTQVVEKFCELPHRQLVVLGEAGAGKSVLAMLLTLGLIERSVGDDPVPVLLSITSWNPQDESVRRFAARRMAEDYPMPAGLSEGQCVAELLMGEGRILLVLDGLDELPAESQERALRRLDEFAATGRPLVVTCRAREYQRAVDASRSIISRAAVVEIMPVDVEQAIAFLSHPEPFRHRWEPVFTHLRHDREGPLARVLSTPLMVSLARTAYRSSNTDPIALTRLDSQDAIAATLLDTFVASVHDPDRPTPPEGRPVRRYSPAAAQRWLGCLALHLQLVGRTELVWWQLSPDLFTFNAEVIRMRTVLAVAVGVGAGVSAAAGPVSGGAAAFTVSAAALAAAAGLLRPLWPHAYPAYTPTSYSLARERRRRVLALRAGFGVAPGLLTGVILGNPLIGAAGALVTGLLALVMPALPSRTRPRGTTPRATLNANHRATAIAAAQHGITGASVFTASVAVLAPASTLWIPAVTAAAVYGWVAACGAGLWTWIDYKITHLRLAAKGRLPWRLWTFLEDQHQRQTLRQSGTAWQFRHALLQHHLAATPYTQHLYACARQGDAGALGRIADRLVEEDRLDEAIAMLGAWADHDASGTAASAGLKLAALLAEHDRVEELRTRADAGDGHAVAILAYRLERQGRIEEAITVLRPHTDRGSAPQLARLLARHDGAQEAIDLLNAHPDQDDNWTLMMAELLAQQGRTEELRVRADQGDRAADNQLAKLLAEQGRVAELQARATAGDPDAAFRLALQSCVEDAITLLRPHADQGDWATGDRLARLLAEQGRVEELRARATAGDPHAAHSLARLLAQQGRLEDAVTLLLHHAVPAVQSVEAYAVLPLLSHLLTRLGREEEAITVLRAHAHLGNTVAVSLLADRDLTPERAEG